MTRGDVPDFRLSRGAISRGAAYSLCDAVQYVLTGQRKLYVESVRYAAYVSLMPESPPKVLRWRLAIEAAWSLSAGRFPR